MNEKITLQDLINLFSEKQGMNKKDAEVFVRTMFELIEEALATEKYVKVKGFGTFKLTEVDSRESVNVNTGERIEIQGHTKVSFTPDATMKELINKPFSHFETVILNEGVELEDTPIEEPETMVQEEMIPETIVAEEKPAIEEVTTIVEEPVLEEPAVEEPIAEEPVIEEPVAEEPVVEETPVIETEEPQESPAVEAIEETPVVEETPMIKETPAMEEAPVVVEPQPEIVATKEKNINRILWGVIVVLVLIILFGAYWMFLRPSDTTEAPVVAPEAQEEMAPVKEHTIKQDTLFDSEPPIYMQPLKLTAEELKKERVPALADTLEYLINGKEPICEHTLQSGETIIRISVKYYGSKRFWPYIAKFNQDAISDPDNIPVGTVIKIPAIIPKN